MLVAAAICPSPPLLIPEVTGAPGAILPAGALAGNTGSPWHVGSGRPQAEVDAEISALRSECAAAVAELAHASPDLLAVVGPGSVTRSFPAGSAGTMRTLGVPVTIGNGGPVLPLSLTVGCWLVDRVLPAATGELHEVAEHERAQDCVRLGTRLGGLAPKVALLVLGDGSARRAISGAPDPEGDEFDAEVAAILRKPDPAALAGLDEALAAQLRAPGRAAWQVLAGAALAGLAGGLPLRATLRFAAAPLGVAYFVASWACGRPVRSARRAGGSAGSRL